MADVCKSREDCTMIQINVVLPNGHAELLTLLPSSTVQDVRTETQRAFGKKYLRLITAKNRVLADFEQTLEEAEIEDGECLTALVLQPQLAATNGAFALWCRGDSAVVTWGFKPFGGDSSAVRDKLRGVHQIQATSGAFAAILEDGYVVTWGDAGCGGDSSSVQDQLRGVQQIQATNYAFAAILEDGPVVAWGGAEYGGDNSAVQDQLKGVRQIQAAAAAFAAILEDGSVVTWGLCQLWRWQFGSSRSAQGCAADSSRSVWGLCCDSGRWIRRHLGLCRLWRWQFVSSRSAQGCTADSSHPGGPSSRLLHLDVLGAPRALCWQKYRVRRGGKTYRAFSGLLHQDVLGALGLCADNSTGCELEKHVRRLVGSLPWGFAFLANEMILR